MDFIPDQPKAAEDVPYYEDATSEAGWQGQSTTKSIETLKSEVVLSISLLGGMVTGFQRGKFVIGEKEREGFRLHYAVEAADGRMSPGRLDIAALPVKNDFSMRRSYDNRREKSLKMSLYMLIIGLNGTRFLEILSPGYAALMPWMLGSGDKTITQLWTDSAMMQNLLPPSESEFIEGDYKTVKQE